MKRSHGATETAVRAAARRRPSVHPEEAEWGKDAKLRGRTHVLAPLL